MSGDPFWVVALTDRSGEDYQAIVFDSPLGEDDPHSGVAVIQPGDPLSKFRGDWWGRALRQLISDYDSLRGYGDQAIGHEEAMSGLGCIREMAVGLVYHPKVVASTTASGRG